MPAFCSLCASDEYTSERETDDGRVLPFAPPGITAPSRMHGSQRRLRFRRSGVMVWAVNWTSGTKFSNACRPMAQSTPTEMSKTASSPITQATRPSCRSGTGIAARHLGVVSKQSAARICFWLLSALLALPTSYIAESRCRLLGQSKTHTPFDPHLTRNDCPRKSSTNTGLSAPIAPIPSARIGACCFLRPTLDQ